MPRTSLEKSIRHKRTRSGMLVPLLEDLFARPVEIDTDEDVEWLTLLLQQVHMRQGARSTNPLYSPSQLASCLRYVYLLKHHGQHEISKVPSRSVSAHYYFFTGNFLHLKWQFALYKLDQKINDPKVFKLIGVEIPVVSKRKDHGGTVDAFCAVYGEPVIVDFKGLNVRTFQSITRGDIPADYPMQLSDYGMLFNSVQRDGVSTITKGLLIAENKGGADAKHPLALHETEITIATHLPEVRGRLKELREYGETNSIPPPECTSTGTVQFQSCPFRRYCREEVKEIERERKRAERKDTEGYKVEVSTRSGNHRARRNSKRRG
jgi:hypothetical protein